VSTKRNVIKNKNTEKIQQQKNTQKYAIVEIGSSWLMITQVYLACLWRELG
jgi:hypothetical protein